MKRIVVMAFAFIFFQTSLSNADTLQDIVGASEREMKSCTTDTDCVVISSYKKCCSVESVNTRFQAFVDGKRSELWAALSASKDPTECARTECYTRPNRAICHQSQCTVSLVTETPAK